MGDKQTRKKLYSLQANLCRILAAELAASQSLYAGLEQVETTGKQTI
ncbi:MAG: hypothetical protein HYX94_07380 [Chloroflexi bacterium]|nr:hypothetical protein [Chloroflexota bacterium]